MTWFLYQLGGDFGRDFSMETLCRVSLPLSVLLFTDSDLFVLLGRSLHALVSGHFFSSIIVFL